MKCETVFSIDPGLTGTGIAVWQTQLFQGRIKWELERTHLLKPYRGTYTWDQKLRQICALMREQIQDYRPTIFYIEQPAFHQSTGGQVTARSGALVKLSAIFGALICVCGEFDNWYVECVPVMRWKGQLKKDICIKRIKKELGFEPSGKVSEHEWDATGIGLWAQGRF